MRLQREALERALRSETLLRETTRWRWRCYLARWRPSPKVSISSWSLRTGTCLTPPFHSVLDPAKPYTIWPLLASIRHVTADSTHISKLTLPPPQTHSHSYLMEKFSVGAKNSVRQSCSLELKVGSISIAKWRSGGFKARFSNVKRKVGRRRPSAFDQRPQVRQGRQSFDHVTATMFNSPRGWRRSVN